MATRHAVAGRGFYVKAATALLPTISKSHRSDWESVSWPRPRIVSQAAAYFTIDSAWMLPASIQMSYWNGRAFLPVSNLEISWATASNQPPRSASTRCGQPGSRAPHGSAAHINRCWDVSGR